ncbi:MAG TPA: serine hydrolase domain-containing protein [Phenylobacterium sp.]|nr:serine hydrolase domain-containing protein [Phenylobacterium sp.]
MENVARVIDERLLRSASEDRFSGAVYVKVAGATLLSAAYGLADREAQIANTPETKFRLGSMNKMFTATAVLQLVQRSELSLQTKVSDLLPEYPNREVATGVTVHQLLGHTSGFGNIWGQEFDAHRLELRTAADYVALFGTQPTEFAPGSAYKYSNYGYILLGRMLEVATGEDYYERVRNHLFDPAGMTRTGSFPEEVDVPERAAGYMRTPEGWRPNWDTLPFRGTPAGGGYSTVGDLDLFAQALMGHRLLDAKHTELLTTGKAEAGDGMRYAYGFMDELDRGVRRIGHTGGAQGMAALYWIYPDAGWQVTVLSNRDAPAAKIVTDLIVGELTKAAAN